MSSPTFDDFGLAPSVRRGVADAGYDAPTPVQAATLPHALAGVDAVINLVSAGPRRIMGLVSAAACILYAVLLLKGGWDYWAPFAALQPTEGRWFPLGFTEGVRDRAFYITDQVPMLGVFRWLEDAINYGESYDKLPRVVPYFILPFSAALLLLRVVQAAIGVWRGERQSLIVSHEAEEAVEQVAAGKAGE